jgi:polyribonucleotide nucleotidyltransferase
MFEEVVETIDWGGTPLTISTGKVARQSDGAVIISMGDTVLLCTAVSSKFDKEGIDFFPLTVHYREMAFASGKIPGGFFKREGKSTEREVLVSRLIDRPIRPLFPSSFFRETQVICTVLSYDPAYPSDILAIIGASAALALSRAPFLEMVAAAKVGYIDGKYILNPSVEQIAQSKLELVVAGTESSVMMVESEAKQLNEKEMLDAVEFGHKAFQPVIKMIEKLVKKAGKEKWPEFAPIVSDEIITQIEKKYKKDIEKAYSLADKISRYTVFDEIRTAIAEDYSDKTDITKLQLNAAFEEVKYRILRSEVLKTGKRIDGRTSTDIRSIDTMVSLLPRTHGSALFTRGETQGLVVTTLGTGQDEQIIDGLDGDSKERFLLHYIFPPYSVGEATPFRAPGRREVGHGKLAWRALMGVLPSKEEFPYTVRVVSEITESNGSSSMATVCGASMSMMDAGVPLKAPVAGIAMGLIKEGKDFVVLSDILGDEDHLGDMDFKVAGTENGITALQMDIKISGITIAIMKQALDQANAGRLHILGRMADSITAARTSVSTHAPMIVSFKIDKDKIREVIGSGGKVIKEICELTGAKIDITDDGMVSVAAVGSDKVNDAVSRIKSIAIDPEFGQIFDGTVAKVLDSGAFINYLPGKDGFIHISEIADERIESIHDRLSEGQKVKVKIIGIDQKGKAKLSMRLDFAHTEKNDKREERPSRDNRGRDDRRDNRDRGDRENRGNRTESTPKETPKEERSETSSDKPAPKRRKAPKSDENSSSDSGRVAERKYFR